MEVVPVMRTTPGGGAVDLPFQRRNVEEWSRLDSLTGMLEHARVETDQWAASSAGSSRQYGKVVDSRARNLVGSGVQQRQKRELEVFQAQLPGGSVQVIRTQSVSSSSAWRGAATQQGFDNLQLSLNPLDLGAQKTKASVGRSGSIGGRRPPSRPRGVVAKAGVVISEEGARHSAIGERLSQVSRICQQIHEETRKKSSFGGSPVSRPYPDDEIEVSAPSIEHADSSADEGGVQIEEIPSDSDQRSSAPAQTSAHKSHLVSGGRIHKNVSRKKSSSTEDLHNVAVEEENSLGSDWRRSSSVRRSLQFPPKATYERTEPIKLRQDIEDRRALDATSLKGYEALKSVLNRGASIADVVNKSMFHVKDNSSGLISDSLANHLQKENMNIQHASDFIPEGFTQSPSRNNRSSQSKRHSFVTVESLKEVRGRLRPLNSPPLEDTSELKSVPREVEEHDDGIVTEDMKHPDSEHVTVPTSRVRSYVYGMEEISSSNRGVGRKAIPGTGSLESRTSSKSSGSAGSRSEEWYNRRKSYGFEPVHSHESDSQSQSIKFRDKNKVESSTDSGICRSSEAVTAGPWARTASNGNKNEVEDLTRKQPIREHSHYTDNYLKMSHNIQVNKVQEERARNKLSNTNDGVDDMIQKGRKTIVTLGNEFDQGGAGYKTRDENSIVVRNSIMKDSSSIALNGFRGGADHKTGVAHLSCSPANIRDTLRPSEPVTITIPIITENTPDIKNDSSNVENKRLFYRQLSEGTALSIESSRSKSVLLNENDLHHSGNNSPVIDRESLLKSSSQSAFKRGTWNGGDWMNPSKVFDNEMKRHSIAVDESKYVREGLRRYSNMHNETNKSTHFEREFANVSTSELAKRFSALPPLRKEDSSMTNANGTGSIPSGINVSFVQNGESLSNEETSDEHLQSYKKQKKVEFCKTEVHFAAESGRVNIVKTDEKPPPTSMIRRHRRNSGPPAVPDPSKGSLPQVRFGDSLYEKKLLGGNETDNNQRTVPLENVNNSTAPSMVPVPHPIATSTSKFQDDADTEDQVYTQANATIVASLSQETTGRRVYDEEQKDYADQLQTALSSSDPMPRSILKNYRKPSAFILGENELVSEQVEKANEEQEEKWGVRLRPVCNKEPAPAMWKSTVTLRNTAFECSQQQESGTKEEAESDHTSRVASGETELQKLLRSLRPATQRKTGSETIISGPLKSPHNSPTASKKHSAENADNGVQVKISSAPHVEARHSSWSVADRIRQVEDLKQLALETKGYSTRVNFGAGEAIVVESGSSDDQQGPAHRPMGLSQMNVSSSLFQQNEQRKPIWARREERKQDLPLHDTKKQTTCNKGLVVRIGKSCPGPNEDQSSTTNSPEVLCRSMDSGIDCKKTTTTITIDLTPSPHCDDDGKKMPFTCSTNRVSAEVLKSPSLIMKTITKPSLHPNVSDDWIDISRKSLGGTNLIQSSSRSTSTEGAVQSKITVQNVQNLKDIFNREREYKDETRKRSENDVKRASSAREEAVPSQLAAFKEMFYGGDASDDSERADEEVRSYMSGGGEEDDVNVKDEEASSVVSGSWSRMRAFRNIRHHFHKFGGSGETTKTRGTSVTDRKKCQEKSRKGFSSCESVSAEGPQRSVATAMLPSYDSSRLRTVETLVSTRSGHPKITSISLRYEGDQDVSGYGAQERETRHNPQKSFMKTNETGDDFRTFTRVATCQTSQGESQPSLLQDKVHDNSNRRAGGTQVSPHSKEMPFNGTVYQSEKQLFHLPKDGTHQALRAVDKEHLYATEISQSVSEKERHRLAEKSICHGRERSCPVRDVKYKSERRSKSPPTNNTSPSSDNKMVDYSANKKVSAPTQYRDHMKDRSLSPPPRTRHKVTPTYFGLSSDTTSASVSHDSLNVKGNRSDNQSKLDNKREISESKHWKYEMERKDDWTAHQRSSSNSRKELKETAITSDCEEIVVKPTQRVKVDNISKEHRTQNYKEKDARSRSTSRGRSQSPSSETPLTKNRNDVRSSMESPVYQNRDVILQESMQGKSEAVETESTILEELTRAADQILQAVNGYTDEDSNRASSEEEEYGGHRRRGKRTVPMRRSANLGTISETPSLRRPKDAGNSGRTTSDTQRSNNNARRTQRLSSKTRLGQTSSTSSVESFTREIRRSSTAQTRALLKKERTSSLEDRAKRKVTSSSTSAVTKPGSRTARLLQRASSREMLLQTHASSSEDVMSGMEGENNRKPRAPRRTRAHGTNLSKTASLTSVASSTKKTSSSSPTTTRLRKKDSVDVPKAKERHASCTQPKNVGSEHPRSKSSRTRDVQRTVEEEDHGRSTRRGGTDLKQRSRPDKPAGGSLNPIAPSRERSDRSSCERRLAGHTSSRPATSHVVTKKKPGSSRKEGVPHAKSAK